MHALTRLYHLGHIRFVHLHHVVHENSGRIHDAFGLHLILHSRLGIGDLHAGDLAL